MAQTKTQRKVVRSLAKGQITIPSDFREALGIDAETLLAITLIDDHMEIVPLRQTEESLRRYTEDDIARFLEEDKLDEEVARRVRGLIQRGQL